jgi:phosphatidylethanolamine/phosphatidyl-N-methylethanolamine N-methyltransferase
VAAAAKADGPILDVGVGTGIELPMFRTSNTVYGVDLCEAMLRRAAERVRREGLNHVGGLYKMDAARMAFPDAYFACVCAPFVLPVTPEPEAMLDELARVVRPGGEIILVNHVSREGDPFAIFEHWLDRHVAPKLGWRPQFPWAVIGDWIDQRADMQLVERRLLAPFNLFTFVRIKRLPASADAPSAPAPTEVEYA